MPKEHQAEKHNAPRQRYVRHQDDDSIVARSAASRLRCCSGGKYSLNHQAVQTSPDPPMMKNTQRQDASSSQWTCRITAAMNGGATTPPTAVPALMMPMAVERSLTGNHSMTARVAAGKPPPSPTPNSSRLAASIMTFAAMP